MRGRPDPANPTYPARTHRDRTHRYRRSLSFNARAQRGARACAVLRARKLGTSGAQLARAPLVQRAHRAELFREIIGARELARGVRLGALGARGRLVCTGRIGVGRACALL